MAFEGAGHLPHNRGGQPTEPHRLPRQRRGASPQMHGRYPEHDVLAQSRHWDEPTREVVMARLQPPAYRHFQAAEVRTLEAFCDTITEQDGEPRIEVLRYIDKDLFEGSGPGHRYADMPPDGEAWRIVAAALDHTAVELADCSFSDLDADARSRVVAGFAGGEIKGAGWDDLPPGTRLVGDHERRRHRLLRTSLGLERDRIRRPRISPRLHAPGRGSAGALGRRGGPGAG